jgi:hypothetical protein
VHNPEITLEGLALADGRKLMNILLGANMNDTTRIYTADAMANLDDYHTTRFFGDAGELHQAGRCDQPTKHCAPHSLSWVLSVMVDTW